MLWDLIYDFFVQFIFGGIDSQGNSFSTYLGNLYYYVDGQQDDLLVITGDLNGFKMPFNGGWFETGDLYMPLGNYLSLISTIITIIAILLFCVFIIKKIIGIIFRLFTGSSAF